MQGVRDLLAPFVTALALATAAGLGLDVLRPGSAVHVHWLGGGPIRGAVAALFAATVLARPALERRWGRAYGWLAAVVAAGTALLAAAGAVAHARAVARGALAGHGSFPNACLLAALLVGAWALASLGPARERAGGGSPLARWATVGAAAAALVLAWIQAVGAVDYGTGRRADAILVLGCRVHADGRPSAALVDRTVTACRLWKRGAAPVILLSGGRTPGAAVSEPEAMRAVALAQDVPASALLLDEGGVDTEASVANALRLSRERGWRDVLAVSHDYHLARIRLLCGRAGLRVRTVPATETAPPGWKVVAEAREVLAWAAAWVL